ncbi:MAG: Abi family protein [Fusobacterium sp.]|nr:Abi family protein [Fusobacterium sp.]MDO5788398.1 Abi family protein [Fusobacterium sp.]
MKEYPFLTFEEQLDLFEKRGLKIKNRERALERIANINYYKLKEFAEPFSKIDEETGEIRYENISFEGIILRFYTDKNLRMYFLDAVEKVEISLKTKIGYILGKEFKSLGYLKFNNWCNKEKYCIYYLRDQEKEFKKKINEYILSRPTLAIKNFFEENKGQNDIPVWFIIELLTFGDLLKLYELMSNKLRKKIAEFYGLEAKTFESYLKNLKLIRNCSAHNGKIIDLKFKTIPSLKKEWQQYLYYENGNLLPGIAITICILKDLIYKINPDYGFGNIQSALNKYINNKDIKAQSLGFKDKTIPRIIFKKEERN